MALLRFALLCRDVIHHPAFSSQECQTHLTDIGKETEKTSTSTRQSGRRPLKEHKKGTTNDSTQDQD
jgi:hypothetical protein